MYSWIGGDRPAETARAAREVVDRGFSAVKMNGTEELSYLDTWDKVDRCVANVDAVRQAVGPEHRHRSGLSRPRAQADGQGPAA
ncbi:hypothetical protein LCL61_19260 [Amycolatopsis coloradensis]|uniref:Uncharacterized protein n=1 Tax=Amycolatopsis coloradensis TaxID=76021 RepID=A0ACD5BEP3_9PSEU